MLLSFYVCSLLLPALFCGPSFPMYLVLLHTSCSFLASFDFLPGLDLFQQLPLFTLCFFTPAFLQWTFQYFAFYFCLTFFLFSILDSCLGPLDLVADQSIGQKTMGNTPLSQYLHAYVNVVTRRAFSGSLEPGVTIIDWLWNCPLGWWFQGTCIKLKHTLFIQPFLSMKGGNLWKAPESNQTFANILNI